MEQLNTARFEKTAEAVRTFFPGVSPCGAMVLGSGWSTAAEPLVSGPTLSYGELPALGDSQVEGHHGYLGVATVSGHDFLVFMGRRHWYEGAGWEPVAAPVQVARALGATFMLLTNAAGGIREDLAPGTLMVVDDHINAMGVTPLHGSSGVWGPRFPDQSEVYDTALRASLDASLGGTPAHGVYLAAAGPAYETPAEIAAYRTMGADAVGMSTVPEAMLANAASLRVAAVSCISNRAAGAAGVPLSHDEVIAVTRQATPRMADCLRGFLEQVVAHAQEGKRGSESTASA